jgi:hypothetical protein
MIVFICFWSFLQQRIANTDSDVVMLMTVSLLHACTSPWTVQLVEALGHCDTSPLEDKAMIGFGKINSCFCSCMQYTSKTFFITPLQLPQQWFTWVDYLVTSALPLSRLLCLVSAAASNRRACDWSSSMKMRILSLRCASWAMGSILSIFIYW